MAFWWGNSHQRTTILVNTDLRVDFDTESTNRRVTQHHCIAANYHEFDSRLRGRLNLPPPTTAATNRFDKSTSLLKHIKPRQIKLLQEQFGGSNGFVHQFLQEYNGEDGVIIQNYAPNSSFLSIGV